MGYWTEDPITRFENKVNGFMNDLNENSPLSEPKAELDRLVMLRTHDGWYVHEVRGCLYASFVPATEKSRAAQFMLEKAPAEQWCQVISSVAGVELEAEYVEAT